MDKSMPEVTLSGREAALLVGALFALAHWAFEQPPAKALVSRRLRDRALPLSRSISKRWRARLHEAGLWDSPTGLWTPELIEQRGVLTDGLTIRESEIDLVVLAIDATKLEFSRDWGEFCVAVPGSIDWYGLEPADLARLRTKLRPNA